MVALPLLTTSSMACALAVVTSYTAVVRRVMMMGIGRDHIQMPTTDGADWAASLGQPKRKLSLHKGQQEHPVRQFAETALHRRQSAEFKV
jgi:hypothetical protein